MAEFSSEELRCIVWRGMVGHVTVSDIGGSIILSIIPSALSGTGSLVELRADSIVSGVLADQIKLAETVVTSDKFSSS